MSADVCMKHQQEDTPENPCRDCKLEAIQKKAFWKNDDIQFARLLAEIDTIGLIEGQYEVLGKAMGLSRGDINELLERAAKVWELIGEEQKRLDAIIEKVTKDNPELDLDDEVHTMKSKEASDINNSGIEVQLEYLSKAGGNDWLEEYVGIEPNDKGKET